MHVVILCSRRASKACVRTKKVFIFTTNRHSSSIFSLLFAVNGFLLSLTAVIITAHASLLYADILITAH